MTDSREASEMLNEHYQRTLQNLALVSSENLHFVGYFENQDDTLEAALRNLNRLFVEKLEVTTSDIVLDVGCGTGGPACYLAEMMGCRVVGIDLGDHQIAEARKLVETKGLSHLVTFYQQDATQMTFESRHFDAVLMMGSASNVQMKERLFAECTRVIKASGRLVLGDAMVVNPDWFLDPRNAIKDKICRAFFGNPFIESLMSYRNLLQSHGFQIIHEQDLSQHMLRSIERWLSAIEQNRSVFVSQLGDSRYRALAKGVKIIAEVAHSGPIGCTIVTAIKQPAMF